MPGCPPWPKIVYVLPLPVWPYCEVGVKFMWASMSNTSSAYSKDCAVVALQAAPHHRQYRLIEYGFVVGLVIKHVV